jgi:hypothetical protein
LARSRKKTTRIGCDLFKSPTEETTDARTARLCSLVAAVESLIRGGRLTLTGIGRSYVGLGHLVLLGRDELAVRAILGAKPSRFGRRKTDYQRDKAAEPWLLATNLWIHSPSQIVALYDSRMKIEEAFRDTKRPRRRKAQPDACATGQYHSQSTRALVVSSRPLSIERPILRTAIGRDQFSCGGASCRARLHFSVAGEWIVLAISHRQSPAQMTGSVGLPKNVC